MTETYTLDELIDYVSVFAAETYASDVDDVVRTLVAGGRVSTASREALPGGVVKTLTGIVQQLDDESIAAARSLYLATPATPSTTDKLTQGSN